MWTPASPWLQSRISGTDDIIVHGYHGLGPVIILPLRYKHHSSSIIWIMQKIETPVIKCRFELDFISNPDLASCDDSLWLRHAVQLINIRNNHAAQDASWRTSAQSLDKKSRTIGYFLLDFLCIHTRIASTSQSTSLTNITDLLNTFPVNTDLCIDHGDALFDVKSLWVGGRGFSPWP